MRDEVVGHPGQGDLADVQLVPGDELQQQVEGALEVVEMDREAGDRLGGQLVYRPDALPGPGRSGRHWARSRCTNALSSPWSATSWSARWIASLTMRPRSTATPW